MILVHEIPYLIRYLDPQEFKERLDKLGYFSHVVIQDFRLDPEFAKRFIESNFVAAKLRPKEMLNLKVGDPEDFLRWPINDYTGRGKALDTRWKKVVVPVSEVLSIQALWLAALSPMAASRYYSSKIVVMLGGVWEPMDELRMTAAGVAALGAVALWMHWHVMTTGKKIEMPFPSRKSRWALLTVMMGTGLIFSAGSSGYLTCVNIIRALGP